MLNRVINGSDEKSRRELISLLEIVCNNNSLRKETIDSARDFLSYQKKQ